MIKTITTSSELPAFVTGVAGARIAIIEARFYREIADALVKGVIEELEGAGATHERFAVPGALEIPQVLAYLSEAGLIQRGDSGVERGVAGFIGAARADEAGAAKPLFDGAIAIGCVIRGETSHYETVCDNANSFWMQIAASRAIPVGNGILTVENADQAWSRADGGRRGKGGDAARACLSLIALRRALNARGMSGSYR